MPLNIQNLSDEFSSKLVTILEGRKASIVEAAGGFPRGLAVRIAWPTLIGEVPNITESLVELFIWKFGSLTVEDLIEAIDSLKKSMSTHVPQSRA